MIDEEGAVCPVRQSGIHCRCWDDGEACCSCEAPAMPPEQKKAQGMEDE